MIATLIVNALAFYLLANIIPGITVTGYEAIIIASLVWGVISMFIRPIIKLLTFPITLVTFGLFSFVINAALLLLTSKIVSGFTIDTFTTALLAAVALSLISSFLNALIRK